MFDNSNLNSVNPNTSTYRIERGTFQTDYKSYRLYMVRTGNIFTSKSTQSRRVADGWALSGEKVIICSSRGAVVGRLVCTGGGHTALKYYEKRADK